MILPPHHNWIWAFCQGLTCVSTLQLWKHIFWQTGFIIGTVPNPICKSTITTFPRCLLFSCCSLLKFFHIRCEWRKWLVGHAPEGDSSRRTAHFTLASVFTLPRETRRESHICSPSFTEQNSFQQLWDFVVMCNCFSRWSLLDVLRLRDLLSAVITWPENVTFSCTNCSFDKLALWPSPAKCFGSVSFSLHFCRSSNYRTISILWKCPSRCQMQCAQTFFEHFIEDSWNLYSTLNLENICILPLTKKLWPKLAVRMNWNTEKFICKMDDRK